MPDLYAVVKSRITGPDFDRITVDIMTRGAGLPRDDVAYLTNYRLRIPRFASDGELLTLLSAEVTRLEMEALPSPLITQIATVDVPLRLRALRPDRHLMFRLVSFLRRAGQV